MKKIYLFTLLIVILTLFTACKSGGTFAMHNRTSYPVWASVDEGLFTEIAGGESYEFKVNTDTQNFLTGEVSRKIKVNVFGQTFSLLDTNQEPPVYTDSTYTIVKAGKTTNAYLAPNRACIKVINEREMMATTVEVWQYKGNAQSRVAVMENIDTNEAKWVRVDPVSPGNQFYYRIAVLMENGDQLVYGGEDWVLQKDELKTHVIKPLVIH